MKRIPESFELSEEDIKEAISFWLDDIHGDGSENKYDIDFKTATKEVQPPPGALIGGQSDWRRQVVTAVARKKD